MISPQDSTFAPPIPLGLLPRGQTGQVSDLVGSPDHVHRLEEIGLRRGCQVEMLQAGTPCIIRLGGHKLCIRAADCFGVLIQRSDDL